MNHQAMHSHISDSTPLRGEGAWLRGTFILLTIIFGLVIDRFGGMSGQLLVSFFCWALLFWLLLQETPAWRITLVFAAAIASAGELVLSVALGWYDYQFLNVPFYIPPGHILLFMLGCLLARHMPDWTQYAIPALALAYGVYAGVSGRSELDTLFMLVFMWAWFVGREARKTYALMLLLSLGLELWGTWLGNWTWQTTVPHLNVSSNNPPLVAGALYVVFDLLIMATARKVHRWQYNLHGYLPTPATSRA